MAVVLSTILSGAASGFWSCAWQSETAEIDRRAPKMVEESRMDEWDELFIVTR